MTIRDTTYCERGLDLGAFAAMSRPSSIIFAIAAAGVLATGVGIFAFCRTKPAPAREPATQAQEVDETSLDEEEAPIGDEKPQLAEHSPATPTPAEPHAAAQAPLATASVTPEAGTPPQDEATLMAAIREIGRSNPLLSLTLAREGNERFKDSPDAAERGWNIVKALTELGRHEEALDEARSMFQKFKGTTWANDVHRHMLVNPPTHPLERGYGKKLEIE